MLPNLRFFQDHLVDYDVASNWGNWVAAAGMTGGRINRFNIAKQSKDYDADGTYLRLWLPELSKVPTKYIHKPWEMPRSVQEASECIIGEDYPFPVYKPPVWDKNNRQSNGKKKPYRGYYEKSKGGRNNKKSNYDLYG